jgi:hypothetical protein
MICRILVQFTRVTKILFLRHISTRKIVPTCAVLIAPNYPTSHYIMYRRWIKYCPLCNVTSSVEIMRNESRREYLWINSKTFPFIGVFNLWLSRQICLLSPGYNNFVLLSNGCYWLRLRNIFCNQSYKFYDWQWLWMNHVICCCL